MRERIVSATPVLSVIVPAYNAEGVIHRTIESLQALSVDREIMIIDDGSTDETETAVSWYATKDPTIKYFKKINGGVSSARNHGVNCARGKYLLFVDQDDLPQVSVIEKSVSLALDRDADAVFWSTSYKQDRETWPCDLVFEDAHLGRHEVRNDLIPSLVLRTESTYCTHIGHIWAGIFRREVVDEYRLEFKSFIDYEDDQLFVYDFLLHANTVEMMNSIGYYWIQYPNSYSHALRQLEMPLRSYENYIQYIMENLPNESIDENKIHEMYAFLRQLSLCEAIRHAGISRTFASENVRELKAALRTEEYRNALRAPFKYIRSTKYLAYLYLTRLHCEGLCVFLTHIYYALYRHLREGQ